MTRDTSPALRRVKAPYSGADIESIMEMLRTRRPHKSKTERAFMREFIEPLGTERDGYGNAWKVIPGDGDNILWSSHVDTVHKTGGKQQIRKQKDVITLGARSKSNCLGGDDTAGVWLMREMILAGKPGVYVFHRAEEIGGLGSDFVLVHEVERLKGIDAAIALDRKGYRDLVTHQFGARGCSESFADSLAIGLSMDF